MPTQRKVFRIEAYMREAPLRETAPAEQPRTLQSVVRELDAIVSEAAQSTQQILAAAEVIDRAALAIASRGQDDHPAAADIRGSTAHIYEACNFHDLVGQRVAKVLDALEGVENKPVTRGAGRKLIHGPRVKGDAGHASQDEIDAILDA